MPPYKTITLELLKSHWALHERLRVQGTLLQSLDQLAMALRSCHLGWMKKLAVTRPGSDPAQLSSEALELAVQDLRDNLPPPRDDGAETLSLDAAIEFLRRHMPPE